jgi:hypothetical protein
MANFSPTAIRTWKIATASAGISGFSAGSFALDTTDFANSLGGGTLSLVQTLNDIEVKFIPPLVPTAARLLSLTAQRAAGDGITVRWQTGVEFNTLGFRLEWRAGEGAWVPAKAGLVPARGYGRPTRYESDPLAVPGNATEVRLLELDLRGATHVLGVATVQPAPALTVRATQAGFQVAVSGAPGSVAIVETATEVAAELWTPVQTVTLDGQGSGAAALGVSSGEPARFYRLRIE